MNPRVALCIQAVQDTLRDVVRTAPAKIDAISPVMIGMERGNEMAQALVFEPGEEIAKYLTFAQIVIREEHLDVVAFSAEAWAVSEDEFRLLPPMDVRTPSVMEGRQEVMTITATDGDMVWVTTAEITRPKHNYTLGPFDEPVVQSNPRGTSVGAALLASVSRNLEDADESARKEQEDRGGADDDAGAQGAAGNGTHP